MKLNKNIIIILSVLFISGCNSVKETLTGAKKDNTDEFLIKKKDSLILPPNFDEMPVPQREIMDVKVQNENIDFSSILTKSKNKKKIIIKKGNSLEKSISNILDKD